MRFPRLQNDAIVDIEFKIIANTYDPQDFSNTSFLVPGSYILVAYTSYLVTGIPGTWYISSFCAVLTSSV